MTREPTIEAFLMPLDRERAEIDHLHALLGAEERDRAAQFRFSQDRDRFIVRRGTLRLLLAERLGRSPTTIRYKAGYFGKPAIVDGDGLEFSLSASAGLALSVIAWGAALGCDIERCNPALADPDVAERLFAPGERRTLRGLAPDQWVQGFFRCWTRKEAFVKATGHGLSRPLDEFEVSLEPGDGARLLAGGEGWSLTAFQPTPGYEAAVVAKQSLVEVLRTVRLA